MSRAKSNSVTPTSPIPESDNVVIVDFTAARQPTSEHARLLSEAAKAKVLKGGGRREMGTRADLTYVNPYLLEVIPGFNSRDMTTPENIAHVDTLARLIAGAGEVKEPLAVIWDNGVPKVTNGHCRLLATFRAIEAYGADISEVPTIPESQNLAKALHDPKLYAQLLAVQIVRNSGKGLAPLEAGELYLKMRDCGTTNEEIARWVGKTPAHVSQTISTLELLTADDRIKSLVKNGNVSASFAKGTIEVNNNNFDDAFGVLNAAVEEATQEAAQEAAELGTPVKPNKPAKPIKALPKHARAAVEKANGTVDASPKDTGKVDAVTTDTKKRKANKPTVTDAEEIYTVAFGKIDNIRGAIRKLVNDVDYECIMRGVRLALLGDPNAKDGEEETTGSQKAA